MAELVEDVEILNMIVLEYEFNAIALIGIRWIDWSVAGIVHILSMAGGRQEDLLCRAAGSKYGGWNVDGIK